MWGYWLRMNWWTIRDGIMRSEMKTFVHKETLDGCILCMHIHVCIIYMYSLVWCIRLHSHIPLSFYYLSLHDLLHSWISIQPIISLHLAQLCPIPCPTTWPFFWLSCSSGGWSDPGGERAELPEHSSRRGSARAQVFTSPHDDCEGCGTTASCPHCGGRDKVDRQLPDHRELGQQQCSRVR